MDPRLVPAVSDAERGAFLAALAGGKSRSAACRAVGVSLSAVRRLCALDASFAEAVEEAEEMKWGIAEDRLFEALDRGEPWAVRLVVKEAEGVRERWRPAPDAGTVTVEVGPGAVAVAELLAELSERRHALEATGRARGTLDSPGPDSASGQDVRHVP